LNSERKSSKAYNDIARGGTCITIGTAVISPSKNKSLKRIAEIVCGVMDGLYAGN